MASLGIGGGGGRMPAGACGSLAANGWGAGAASPRLSHS